MEEAYYDEYFKVQSSHWWFQGRKEIILSVLNQYLNGQKSSAKILDLGCGTGFMASALGSLGYAVGLDRSQTALAFCQQAASVPLLQGDFRQLPIREGAFDVVCALDVLEHLDEEKECLVEAHRICRRGGYFLLTVPAYPFLWGAQDVVSHHKRRYIKKQIEELVKANGFRPVKTSYFNTLFFPPIALFRLLAPFKQEKEIKSDFRVQVPAAVNHFFSSLFASERHWLQRFNFPFGVSILCLAKKES